jgi:uncharacterized protein YegL
MTEIFPYDAPQMLSNRDLNAQLQEALVMAGMASLRNDISVEFGEWWTFNWKTNVISLPREELVSCPREEISWIILHEAAHAALTRLHDILPHATLQRPELQLLLNCVEDVRIENWLQERFPGARPWKKITDARSSTHDPATMEEAEQENPARGFLRGLVRFGGTGAIPSVMNATALVALEEARPALEAAFDCVPPSTSVDPASVERLYRQHPVSRCYADTDRKQEPSPMEKWVRIMQASMWTHVATGVLPVFMRLIKEFGCPEGMGQRTIRVTHSGVSGDNSRSHADLQKALRAELENGGSGRYLKTVQKYDAQICIITELLQRLLPNHRSLRHIRGCRTGDRLDLRIAAQFEADRRLYEKLWQRREKPTLPEPAFVFVMDRSSSMRSHGKSLAAYESLVLIRESCTRVGIPFAVIMFNSQAEVIHGWEHMNDDASEAALSAILRTNGGTSVSEGLTCASSELEQRHERDRYVFLMTDGAVCESDRVKITKWLTQFEQDDIRVLPFGLGHESEEITNIFPGAEIVREAAEFPASLSRSLLRVLGSGQY